MRSDEGVESSKILRMKQPCLLINLSTVLIILLTSGIYFSVVQEGEVGAEDAIEQNRTDQIRSDQISRDENNITVADIVKIYVREANDDLVRRAVRVPALAAELRTYFRQQLESHH